jgi:hypothetical protein
VVFILQVMGIEYTLVLGFVRKGQNWYAEYEKVGKAITCCRIYLVNENGRSSLEVRSVLADFH